MQKRLGFGFLCDSATEEACSENDDEISLNLDVLDISVDDSMYNIALTSDCVQSLERKLAICLVLQV